MTILPVALAIAHAMALTIGHPSKCMLFRFSSLLYRSL